MAIYRWIQAGRSAFSFDTDTGLISQDGETDREPTLEEQAFIDQTFLNVPPPEPPPTPHDAVLAQLRNAVTALRSVVADSYVSNVEAQSTQAVVLPALRAYSALPADVLTPEIQQEADRLFSRTLQALFIMGGQTVAALTETHLVLSGMTAQLQDALDVVTALEARVEALETQ
jgi:hypothetical protein